MPDDGLPNSESGNESGNESGRESEDTSDWRDEYLDEQLEAHAERADVDDDAPARQPMSRFRHGSLGITLGAAMTGLGNVLEPRKKEEAPVVVQHDEPDHSQDPVELQLDHDDPGASVFIIRKWVDGEH